MTTYYSIAYFSIRTQITNFHVCIISHFRIPEAHDDERKFVHVIMAEQ